jgi:hypothetical protein
LKLVDDDAENLRLHIPIGENKKQGVPRILALIDTLVLARDKDGKAVSLAIGIAATGDLLCSTRRSCRSCCNGPMPGTPGFRRSGSMSPAGGCSPPRR